MNINQIGVDYYQCGLAVSRDHGTQDYLLMIVNSPALFIIHGKEYMIKTRQAVLYNAGTPQYYYAVNGLPFASDWFHFSMTAEEKKQLQLMGILFDTPLPVDDNGTLHTLIQLMADEYYHAGSTKDAMLSACLRAFFIKLSESVSTGEISQPRSRYSDQLIRLREQIYTNPEQEWCVEAMSRKICVSRTHFHRLYMEEFGITCMQDVTAARIASAKEYLSQSVQSIHTISERVGYENYATFVRVFKKAVGLTPSEYRSSLYK
ncbi:MAG: helix-turn-helix transcriptional regulator [Ruminococcus sp.]|nr:helix-turn-helix transcriptional regulator [Ruminococcus sp.]